MLPRRPSTGSSESCPIGSFRAKAIVLAIQDGQFSIDQLWMALPCLAIGCYVTWSPSHAQRPRTRTARCLTVHAPPHYGMDQQKCHTNVSNFGGSVRLRDRTGYAPQFPAIAPANIPKLRQPPLSSKRILQLHNHQKSCHVASSKDSKKVACACDSNERSAALPDFDGDY